MRDESISRLLISIGLVSINQPKSDILPGMAETMPVWPVFILKLNCCRFRAKLPVLKIPAVPAGMVGLRLFGVCLDIAYFVEIEK